jgi:ferredoxin
MPESENILRFNGEKIEEEEEKGIKTIIFGARKCDLNSLQILDKVMFNQGYIKKRKNAVLIGLYCEKPDDSCFCNSMGLKDYYDLFFYPYKDKYYVSIGTNKGLALVKNLPTAKKDIKKEILNKKELENKDINKNYRNKIWESDAEKCLSCSACTIYCPTCNCFDIEDGLNIDLKSGERKKSQMSCQLKSFSKVAGGKIFRDSRLSRVKHFVYHKIVYYKERFGRYMCVGCGRCLRVCPTKIDWTRTINLLKDEEEIKKENGLFAKRV